MNSSKRKQMLIWFSHLRLIIKFAQDQYEHDDKIEVSGLDTKALEMSCHKY